MAAGENSRRQQVFVALLLGAILGVVFLATVMVGLALPVSKSSVGCILLGTIVTNMLIITSANYSIVRFRAETVGVIGSSEQASRKRGHVAIAFCVPLLGGGIMIVGGLALLGASLLALVLASGAQESLVMAFCGEFVFCFGCAQIYRANALRRIQNKIEHDKKRPFNLPFGN